MQLTANSFNKACEHGWILMVGEDVAMVGCKLVVSLGRLSLSSGICMGYEGNISSQRHLLSFL